MESGQFETAETNTSTKYKCDHPPPNEAKVTQKSKWQNEEK